MNCFGPKARAFLGLLLLGCGLSLAALCLYWGCGKKEIVLANGATDHGAAALLWGLVFAGLGIILGIVPGFYILRSSLRELTSARSKARRRAPGRMSPRGTRGPVARRSYSRISDYLDGPRAGFSGSFMIAFGLFLALGAIGVTLKPLLAVCTSGAFCNPGVPLSIAVYGAGLLIPGIWIVWLGVRQREMECTRTDRRLKPRKHPSPKPRRHASPFSGPSNSGPVIPWWRRHW